MGIPYTLCSKENRENLRPENSASSSPSGCGIPAMLNSQSATHWVGCSPSAARNRPCATTLSWLGRQDACQVARGRSRLTERNQSGLTCIILSKNQRLPTILQDGFKPLEHPSIGIRMHGGVEALPSKQSCCVMPHYGRRSSIFRQNREPLHGGFSSRMHYI